MQSAGVGGPGKAVVKTMKCQAKVFELYFKSNRGTAESCEQWVKWPKWGWKDFKVDARKI